MFKPKPKGIGVMIAIGKPKGDMPPRPRNLEDPDEPEAQDEAPMDDEGTEEQPEQEQQPSVEERIARIETLVTQILDYCRKDHAEPDGDEGGNPGFDDNGKYAS